MPILYQPFVNPAFHIVKYSHAMFPSSGKKQVKMTSHHLIEMNFHGKKQVQKGYRVYQIHIFRFVMANRPFLPIRT